MRHSIGRQRPWKRYSGPLAPARSRTSSTYRSVLSLPPLVNVQAWRAVTPMGISGQPASSMPVTSKPAPWMPISWLICGVE
jgi:hypothetical protein